MKKSTKEFFTTEAALIERENEILAGLKTEYGAEDLEPDHTEPNLLSSIKGCLTKYLELRSKFICKVDLLEKIHQRFCLYRLLVPGFYSGPLRSYQDLKAARTALREPTTPAAKQGNQAFIPAALPKTAAVKEVMLPVANQISSSGDLNELLRSLAAQVTSGQAHVILIVLNGEIAA